MSESFRTVAAPVRFEGDKIKGSRFVADVAPVGCVPEAGERLEAIRREFSDANHHCWAYRLGVTGDDHRWADDGEPSGSAGRPILQQIDGAGLTDVLVVVTRWFGGTRLGVGGLVRAYGGAAAAALDRATIRTVVVTQRLFVRHAYDDSSRVEAVLREFALEPVDVDYGEAVVARFDVPLDRVEAFRRGLLDATAGRVTIVPA